MPGSRQPEHYRQRRGFFVEGHSWDRQVDERRNAAVTSTYHLAVFLLSVKLSIWAHMLSVYYTFACRVILFILYCPLQKTMYITFSAVNGRWLETIQNYYCG